MKFKIIFVAMILLPQICFAGVPADNKAITDSIELANQGKSLNAITKAMTIVDPELQKKAISEINDESASKF